MASYPEGQGVDRRGTGICRRSLDALDRKPCLTIISVIRHIAFVPFVLRLHLLGILLRIADDDGVERNHGLGEMQKGLHTLVSFFERVEGSPYCAQSQTVRHEENILCGGGTVLYPKLLFDSFEPLVEASADHDGERSLFHHAGVWAEGRDLFENASVVDDHEMPGLLVASRRCSHACSQKHLDLFFLDGLGSIASHGGSSHDMVENSVLFHNRKVWMVIR